METRELLPLVNASLNGLSTLLLLSGFVLIKTGRREAHRLCMISAFVVSVLFLGNYLNYHFRFESNKFGGEGLARTVYLLILFTHIPLAALVPVGAVGSILIASWGQFERHRRWTRWTFPVWMYVSVTGVLIYLFLYVWFEPIRLS